MKANHYSVFSLKGGDSILVVTLHGALPSTEAAKAALDELGFRFATIEDGITFATLAQQDATDLALEGLSEFLLIPILGSCWRDAKGDLRCLALSAPRKRENEVEFVLLFADEVEWEDGSFLVVPK